MKIPDYRKEVQDAISSGKWFIRLAYNPNTNPQWAENIWVVKHKSPNCDSPPLVEEKGADDEELDRLSLVQHKEVVFHW